MEYLIAKWLHILFSTFLFGTGVGSAFYLFFSTLQRNTTVVAGVAQLVVRADWLFTATTVVLQPLSGIYLVHLLGHPLSARWLQWSIVLYVIAIGCWLPVVLAADTDAEFSSGSCTPGRAFAARILALLLSLGRAWHSRTPSVSHHLLADGRPTSLTHP